jgi:hypothetical protein
VIEWRLPLDKVQAAVKKLLPRLRNGNSEVFVAPAAPTFCRASQHTSLPYSLAAAAAAAAAAATAATAPAPS